MNIGNKIVIGLGGAVAVFLAIGLATSGSSGDATTSSSKTSASARPISASEKAKAAAVALAPEQSSCMAIEDAWTTVVQALAGAGTTTTLADIAPALKDGAGSWQGEALIASDAGKAAMARALNAGADAALRLRVDLQTQNNATLAKDSTSLKQQIGGVVVPACKAAFGQ